MVIAEFFHEEFDWSFFIFNHYALVVVFVRITPVFIFAVARISEETINKFQVCVCPLVHISICTVVDIAGESALLLWIRMNTNALGHSVK